MLSLTHGTIFLVSYWILRQGLMDGLELTIISDDLEPLILLPPSVEITGILYHAWFYAVLGNGTQGFVHARQLPTELHPQVFWRQGLTI